MCLLVVYHWLLLTGLQGSLWYGDTSLKAMASEYVVGLILGYRHTCDEQGKMCENHPVIVPLVVVSELPKLVFPKIKLLKILK